MNAFLTSRKALGLDVAGGRATADALQRALPEVALTPVAQLAGRHLAADDFDRMLAADVIRDLLRWLGDPDAARNRMGPNGWDAFCARCREELEFDPAHEADVVAGARLAQGDGAWAAVWERFAEAPDRYGDIAGVLRRSRPSGGFRFDRDRWPDLNEEDEGAVRRALAEIPKLQHGAACEAVVRLEREHGGRRDSVWARLEQVPMAEVLKPLASLATAVQSVVGGTEPADVASAYLEYGCRADLGAWEALAGAPIADEGCIVTAVRHLLEPWLDESARTFQGGPWAHATARVGRATDGGGGRGRLPPVRGRTAVRLGAAFGGAARCPRVSYRSASPVGGAADGYGHGETGHHTGGREDRGGCAGCYVQREDARQRQAGQRTEPARSNGSAWLSDPRRRWPGCSLQPSGARLVGDGQV